VQAVAANPLTKIHVHYDERGLGFLALGLAKATLHPVVIISTSGTAVGNLLPAIMEAHHSFIPLIFLSADRPHELRDCGANQTTDQVKIFQSYLRWQIDLPVKGTTSYFQSIATQSHFYSLQNPPGPVQINCPFAEPLYQSSIEKSSLKPIDIHLPRLRVPPFSTPHAKGLILIGRLPDPNDVLPILELAERLRWPVCADILSNARNFPTVEQLQYFDYNPKPRADFILHFGERLTSKKILDYLSLAQAEYIHVSPYPSLQDPSRLLTGRIQADIPEFCKLFEGKTDPFWLDQWKDEEPQFEENGSFTEVHAMRKISQILPSHFAVFLGNGMPIRDGDHFLFPKECAAFFGNRGLSGIDGNIATVAGLAENGPILAFIGDQAALHDLNSLPLLKKTKHPVILLISNNFGGGIFHHLPVVNAPQFETLWAASHTIRFQSAATLFDLPYHPFEDLESLFKSNTSSIVELFTNRIANHTYQTSLLLFAEDANTAMEVRR
jgi:2-succinyl-5-enolpyruvyl-6-hydroxy-3-cyclohexene-1-carboxylate synthase